MIKELKESLKKQLINDLSSEEEIIKIVLFGSFVHSDNPNDIDVAIFQTSKESYSSVDSQYIKENSN
jgi:predicted nucleotidyltransferase